MVGALVFVQQLALVNDAGTDNNAKANEVDVAKCSYKDVLIKGEE